MTTSSSEFHEASLGKRYFFKLCSNMATIPLFLLQETILPRVLGPSAYGNYNFLAAFYTQIVSFLDLGTSTCMRTGLSKRPGEAGIVTFYLRIILLLFAGMLLAGAVMYLPGVSAALLPEVPLWMVFPAAVCVYLIWLASTVRGMNDAMGNTTSSEVVRMAVNMAAALALLGLFLLDALNMPLFYLQQGLTYALLAAGFAYAFKKGWVERSGPWNFRASCFLTPQETRAYIREYRDYCGPLFTMTLCSALALMAERWILQYFGGSHAQGYFSLSQKVGMACFLFVTAMMPLLQRELSMAHQKKDAMAMGFIVERFAPLLYAVAAWFACFTSVEAQAVIRLFAGLDFAEALLPVQIMAFYPVHQCYGQLAGAIYYASGDTSSLRNITVAGLLVGLVCAWVFLAPRGMGGVDLGAAGLSLKMVLVQIATVNVLMWRCSRKIPFSFGKNLLHQILCPVCFLLLAFATKATTLAFLPFGSTDVIRFFLSGFLYALLSAALLFAFPFAAGITRKDLHGYVARGKRWIDRKRKIS